jgi:hypothetical protein
MPITSCSAASGWLVLLAGPPPEISLLAKHVGSREIRIVQTAGLFFLKATELDGLTDSRAVEWVAAALLEELDFAARLRLGSIYPIQCGGAIAVRADGTWDQHAVDGAVENIKFYFRPLPSEGLSLDQIVMVTRLHPHLRRAVTAFGHGSSVRSLRQVLREIELDIGGPAEEWVGARGWFPLGYGARLQRALGNSQPHLTPSASDDAPISPLAASAFLRDLLERVITHRLSNENRLQGAIRADPNDR